MYNKEKNQQYETLARKEGKKIICFNCQKPKYIITEYSDIKIKPSSSNKPKKPFKKKALKATWDSESEYE